MRKSYQYLFIVIILTIILILYYRLGGFRGPEITYVNIHEYRLAGSYYEGSLKNDRWEQLFQKTRKYVTGGLLKGPLVILWYNHPKEDTDEARAFIGVELHDGEEIPEGLEVREIKMDGVVRATIRAHALVMAKPEDIEEKIRDFARNKDLVLQNIMIDKYPEESLVISEIPVQVSMLKSG